MQGVGWLLCPPSALQVQSRRQEQLAATSSALSLVPCPPYPGGTQAGAARPTGAPVIDRPDPALLNKPRQDRIIVKLGGSGSGQKARAGQGIKTEPVPAGKTPQQAVADAAKRPGALAGCAGWPAGCWRPDTASAELALQASLPRSPAMFTKGCLLVAEGPAEGEGRRCAIAHNRCAPLQLLPQRWSTRSWTMRWGLTWRPMTPSMATSGTWGRCVGWRVG